MLSLLKKLFRSRNAIEQTDCATPATQQAPLDCAPEIPGATNTLPPSGGAEFIELPLKAIIDQIPGSVRAAMRRPFTSQDRSLIPLRVVLPQLSQGRVRITFGELARSAPSDLFRDSQEHDDLPINLPLHEMISRLDPRLLRRRAEQKCIAISDEMFPLFGPAGRVSLTVKTSDQQTGSAGATHLGLRDVPPSITPPPQPLPVPSASQESPSSSLNGTFSPRLAGVSHSALDGVGTTAPRSNPVAPTTSIPAPPALENRGSSFEKKDSLALPLTALIASWPESVRQELSPFNLSEAVLNLPIKELESALKRGSVKFAWKQLRSWIQPPLPLSQNAASTEVLVELPLGVVAPKFLTLRKPSPPRKPRYDVTEAIPQLFGNSNSNPSGARSVSPAPEAPLPTSPMTRPVETAEGVASPSVGHVEGPASDVPLAPPQNSQTPDAGRAPDFHLGHIFGQPAKRFWTVSEIVRQTAQLKGATGALLVTQDGLLIAAELPPRLSAETLAGFVPQIFSKMVQYSKELGFGEPRHLTFTLEETSFQIHKTGCVYLTLLGQAREPLPSAQLSAVAAALTRPALSS